jgi:hypothetical protein
MGALFNNIFFQLDFFVALLVCGVCRVKLGGVCSIAHIKQNLQAEITRTFTAVRNYLVVFRSAQVAEKYIYFVYVSEQKLGQVE